MKTITLFTLLLLSPLPGLWAQQASIFIKATLDNGRKSENIDLQLTMKENKLAAISSEYRDSTIYKVTRNMVSIPEKKVIEIRYRNGDTSAKRYVISEKVLEGYANERDPEYDTSKVQVTDEYQKINGYKCRKYVVDNNLQLWITKKYKISTRQVFRLFCIAIGFGEKLEPDDFSPELDYVLDQGFPMMMRFENPKGRGSMKMEVVKLSRKVDQGLFDTTGFRIETVQSLRKSYMSIDDGIAPEMNVIEAPRLDEFAPVQEDKIFVSVEKPPRFPGGEEALYRYLTENMRYPEMENVNNIQGQVVLSFVVLQDGSIDNVKILKGVSQGINKEAIRLINSMPNWEPGQQRGKPVKVLYTLPIRFTLKK